MAIIHVSSHRRSGTHALIDLLRSRFAVYGDYYFHLEEIGADVLVGARPVIVKSHEWRKGVKLERLRGERPDSFLRAAERDCLYLYVHRDPYDVLKSLYYFNLAGLEPVYQIPTETGFEQFLRQCGVQDAARGEDRVSFWFRCVRNWVDAPGVTALSFDEVVRRPDAVVGRVADMLGREPSEIEPGESTAVGRETTGAMSKGDPWDAACRAFFREVADPDLMDRLGYAMR